MENIKSDVEEKSNLKLSKTVKLSIFASILLLIVGAILFFVFLNKDDVTSRSEDEGVPFVSFIPIWTAFVPSIIAARKKRRQLLNKKEKFFLVFILGLTTLLVVSTIIFF